MKLPLFNLIALILASILNGCITPVRDRQTFTVSNSQTYFFEETSPPDTELFNRTIQAAIEGNDEALATVLSWNQFTDGEGALNYASMLLDLKKKVGHSRFERAKQTLTSEQQARVNSSLNTAIRMKHFMKKNGLQ